MKQQPHAGFVRISLIILSFLALSAESVSAGVLTDPVINEFVANHTGTDTEAFIEIYGGPTTDYSAYTLLEIEGDSGNTGNVDAALPVGVTNAGGYWTDPEDMENGTITILLVEGWSGSVNVDLDTNDDGVIDVTPWTRIVDDVAVNDGGASDLTYSSTELVDNYDGQPFSPGGASRIPDGTDTDTTNDWVRNDFDGYGFDGFPGTADPGEAENTPGAMNALITGQSADPVINEFVANHTGTDSEAFIEVFGAPGTDLSTFTVLEIEGDSGATGNIDAALPAGVTNAGGYWTNPEDMENGTITILLVEGFSGGVNDDIDTNDDGVIDVTPWTRIVDDVAVSDGGGSDQTYSSTVLTASFDGGSFTVGGASRIPNGQDTDSTSDWVRNDFDGYGLPGFDGTPDLGEAANTPGAENAEITILIDPVGACGDSATMIHDIQGNGPTSPDVGNIREIEAVVVAVFQGPEQIGGYNLQEEDDQADADPVTSEGLYIFDNTNSPAVGDLVRVRGAITEYNGLTEMNSVAGFEVCGTGTATSASITLPVTSVDDFENYEGMAVVFPQTLVISEYFNFDRYNEVVLTSTRHMATTAEFEPGPDAVQAELDYQLDSIMLDDARGVQNPEVTLHPDGSVFSLDHRFRGGDLLADVAGVMDYARGSYRIQPTQARSYTEVNPRPPAPDAVGGSLKVASLNVLNYFTTLDYPFGDPLDDKCGPLENQGCRGADADQPDEFTRQRDKIVAALVAIDADIVGLIEIENNPADVPTADLVSGLNDVLGAGTYDYIATGAIGIDAIRQAIIYKPANATPDGAFAILDSSVDADFNDEYNRPVLAQTFRDNATTGRFTVAVNHLKSKGSDCNALGDPDTGDGSGNCNITRTMAAQAIVDWLATDPTASGDDDFLLVGDLNSYDREDPIDALVAGGYTDLADAFIGDSAYSYVFDGRTGYLDYALAGANLSGQVTGTTIWHINADEPDILDYDTSFKSDGQDALYAPDAYRASDHDPVIVGLDLIPVADVSVTKTDDPDPVVAGAQLTYTITVSNAGPDDAFDVVVTDNLPLGLTLVSTTGCAEDPAGSPDCTLGTIAAGSSAEYTIVTAVDVGLQTGTVLTNSAVAATSSFDPDEGNNTSSPATETTVITEAYWDVTKYWNRDGGGSVNITLTCNDVVVDSGVATPGTPTTLTVSGFDNGNTSCVVTEDVPGGTFEQYSVDCSVDDVVSATTYICDIGNSEAFATFAVRKRFMDGNDVTPVTFHMDCNNGLPTEQQLTVVPDEGDFDRGTFEVNFVVTKFSPGQMDCTVYEEPVGGYTASYVCGSVNNPDQVCTDGDPSALDQFGDGPCFFEDVDSSGAYDSINYCTIRNYPNPGEIDITKEWIIEGAGGNTLDLEALIELVSTAEVEGSLECRGNQWCRKVMFDKGPDSETKTLWVETSFEGTVITLEEELFDSTFLSENDCGGELTVYPTGYLGNDGMEQCTFTNTAFFEGIPTLNQYGMALLALLMLGVGLVGFRRM